jgi:hypothetical protein
MGGCGDGILELIHAMEANDVSNLLNYEQELLEKHKQAICHKMFK